MEYLTKNHSKFLLMYHFIFVLKYRKNIINKFPIQSVLKEISENQSFNILKMETDKDHIHLLIQSESKISPLQIVRRLKQLYTIWLWKNFENELKREFRKEHTFWSDGYFVCSIGNVSEKAIRRYIDEQG
jgi:putative transposase